ncbi:hypothetical protein L6164_008067 [Bauhinia variegata]|uniref:Uncharacterized protein n=1 Tax=Bauhinia variegata TaxID=167791 RepID=A0ACB9PGX4_BAUVA|nr:hypothetical protein L6164_008067 [Bauhinia variegata]
MGNRNWFDIALSLGTNRTPLQCLARYQRSLNPSILHSEWTEEEDAQLCSAVATFGESNWQAVASVLERRTGTQCSNRWKKALCPERKGGYTQEEDERLTVAVLLFGRKWYQIAKFVPGRTQAQCRDRYVNSLDPSLKWGGWTKEEDSKLKAAIAKYGFCWSKIAEDIPPRTDSQCRKRWKVLCPEQVPLLQEARKRRKALIGNFVDRESERPALLNDFEPLAMIGPPSDVETSNLPKKQKLKRSNRPKKMKPRRRAVEAQTMKIQETVKEDEVEIGGIHDKPIEGVLDHCLFPTASVSMTTNSCETHLDLSPRVEAKVQNGKDDDDNLTLACFLHKRSKKKKLECKKDLSPARDESESLWDVGKHSKNELSQKCDAGGTPYLSPNPDDAGNMQTETSVNEPGEIDAVMENNAARDGEAKNSEDVNMRTDHDDSDLTLACFMRNKSKKRGRAAKGSPDCPSDKQHVPRRSCRGPIKNPRYLY